MPAYDYAHAGVKSWLEFIEQGLSYKLFHRNLLIAMGGSRQPLKPYFLFNHKAPKFQKDPQDMYPPLHHHRRRILYFQEPLARMNKCTTKHSF